MGDLLKRRRWMIVGVLVLGLGASGWIGSSYLAGMRTAEFWQSTIADFEEQDRAQPPEPGAILFTGSSSIRMWGGLARDMAPLRVINRGFGGSHIAHVSHYASRIVHPYRPSAVVLYAGDNDLSKDTGKTAESVFSDFRDFVALVHGELPDTPVYFISIKPSLSRWDRWPIMRDANARIAAWATATDGVEYLDVATPMLGDSGEPRPELFILDGLHMSDTGYAVWTRVVKPALLARSDPAPARSR